MPVAWDQFESVDAPTTDVNWQDFEPVKDEAPASAPFDESKIKLSPYDQATMDRGGVKPPSGMESGTELTTALGQAGMRVAAPVLEPVNRALSYAGNVARAIPADIAESVAGNEKYYDMLNLGAAALGEPMPIDEQLKEASSESPGWAVTGKVAQGIAGMIPTVMAFGGLPAAAQKVALAGFTVKQLSDFKDASSQLGDELGKPKEQQDPDKITSLVSELAQTGLFAGAGIYGGRKMIAPNIKAPPARIGMPAPELTGAEKIARPGVFAPDQLRAGPLRWAGEPLPLPTGMAPAPSTAQLAPPAQRDLSAQGQIDALMREGRGPAPSTATPPTDLARTAPARGTGLAPEGRGRPFDPKFPEAPVPTASGKYLNIPKGAKPHPQQALLDDIIQEGVKRSDAEALIAGTKTVKQVVDENLNIVTPSRDFSELAERPNSSFGHADAMEEGYRNAIARLSQLLDLHETRPPEGGAPVPVPTPTKPSAPAGAGVASVADMKERGSRVGADHYGRVGGKDLFRFTDPTAEPGKPNQITFTVPKGADPATIAAARKLAFVRARVAEGIPDENIQVGVNGYGPEFPGQGHVQVDEVRHPRAGNVFSANPEVMIQAGLDMPTSKELLKLPNGNYTLPQVKAKLAELKAKESPAPPAPSAAPVAPALPASSVGLSAPVDVTQPPKAKKPYNMASFRAPADEFKQLVLENGEQQGWIKRPDFIHPGATGYAAISHNTEMTSAYKRALEAIGIKTDRNTLKLHAEALPKLKAFLEAHAKLEPVALENMGEGSEFTINGEKFTVGKTSADSGKVTIADGRTFKVDAQGIVKIDPGSLKVVEMSADFVPEPAPPTPKLRPGEKGTADLLQGPEAPFNLAGEVQGDPARIAAEAKAKADSAAAAKALAAKQQPDLFGQPPTASLVNPTQGPGGIGGGIQRAMDKGRQGEAGFVTIPQGVTDAVLKAAEYVGELYREELNAPKMNDRRRAVLNWSAKLQRSFGEAAAKQRDILKRVPSPIRRDGITNWIQADGDAATLAQRRADTASWRDPSTGKPHPDAKRLLAGYDAALHLTPEEIAVANQVKGDYARFAARGQAADVLDTLKDNYVTQTWNLDRGPAGTGSSRTLKEKFRFSRASTFANYFEGEQAGYSPKTKDISKLLPMYSHEMNAVIAARQLVAEMGNGVASDGRPLLAPKGIGIPVDDPVKGEATLVMPKVGDKDIRDYKVLANQPALSKWKWVSKDSAGNPVMLKADLALHPEAFKHLQAILGRSAIRDWYGTPTTALAAIPKGLVHGIDWANSETKRTMLGMLATFHQVQTGTHAIGHRVNPFFSIPKVDLVGNPIQMDAARHGLMMLPDRASESQFMEGFKASGLVSRIPGIGPISDWYSHYLFTQYIPGLKFKTYQAILERNLKVYDRQITSGRVSGADVKVLSAEQANAAYGHLNYADLGRNPTIQHIAQLGLLAPDFLEARGRFSGQAIKGLTGAKVGREQLLALATLAIAQSALAYTSAQITGGEWDKKRPFEFTLGNRRYTMRSVPEDLQNLISDMRKFAHSRLSPIIGKGALQYATGVDYRGRKISAGQTTKELATQPIPLSIRGFAGIGQSTLSGMEQLAGTIGVRISRYSPMMDMHDLIVDFKKSSNDPKLQADIALQEQEVFDSPYEKLRNVLHSGDLAAARKEYDKLAGIRTTKQIDNAMKPWTGGNLNVKTLTMSPAKPKPFTGSPKIEQAFVQSLTPEQQKTYQKATAERAKFYQTFQDMLRTTKETERELTDAEVGITP